MYVIRHQNVSMNENFVSLRSVSQYVQVDRSIRVVMKTELSVVASLRDVLGHSCQIEAAWSGHAQEVRSAAFARLPDFAI
jgi:hypothetical protein